MRPGERVALRFDARMLSLFDAATSRALPSELHERVVGDG
jgi:hypothetical protein